MINLMTPINQLGYGVAGLNILKGLQDRTDVALHMIGQPQVTNQADADAVKKGLETAKLFDSNAPCIKIWHQNQMAERIGSGKFIGFPIFELDTFNSLEKHQLSSCEHLFVCSEWAKQICLNNLDRGEHRIHVVPLGVDAELFPPAPVRQDDKTIFFNCGKWEIRKGHDILINAFKKVLEHGEDAELWMMCSNPFNSPEENQRWTQLYNHPKIKIIPRAETQAEVYNIMSQVDCGVFPSRGEGWNLELLEMMSAGKHVVATNYSAHTEFCTQDNCGLVPIKEVEPAYDGKWFFQQGNWAKIDAHVEMDLYMKMMRFILDYKGTLNEAGIETARNFSWSNTCEKIIRIL
jgi:glycosyltransferase involved in cell wall biosynthesis